jgi:hypothetical protein
MDNNGRKAALVLGASVYLGVVIIATSLTISFVIGVLSADAHLLRGILTIGVILVGLNSIALPVALHFWAISGLHRASAIGLYGLDMVILAFNLVTSYSTLSGRAPAWVASYAPYSVGMFVVALATWAVLFVTDPGERARVAAEKAREQFRVSAILKAAAFLETVEGQAAIGEEAARMLPQMLQTSVNTRQHWQGGIPVSLDANPTTRQQI